MAKKKTKTLSWLAQAFGAKQVRKGNVISRAKKDVLRLVGERELKAEIKRRKYHLVTIGTQYVMFCNPGKMKVVC